jgi:hypothetical protein
MCAFRYYYSKPQYSHCIITKYVLGFLIISSERLRDSAIVRIDAVPLLSILFQGWEEWVISTCSILISRLK